MITTARQLKDLIRNLSKKKSADAQILMRNYMMERFLERISLSEYKDKFICGTYLEIGVLETVISRNVMNTRMRDFYDIYILQKLHGEQLNKEILWNALVATARKRGTLKQIESGDIREILNEIETSSVMENLWKAYQKNYSYAVDISWYIVMESVRYLYQIGCSADF